MAEPTIPLKPTTQVGGAYPSYVLGVLVLVYIFNFLDRQILSILAENIKADLGLNDAEIGFLYGTAFAVFYAIFGIPLGRLADVWNRRSLIAVGLTFWSVMTAVSGLSRNFLQIAAARIGVGVGEASATPAAFSMLSDYFPAARRATVLAIYSSGIYLGAGLGLMIGGLVVGRWDAMWLTEPAPFGLKGWQVAFFVVGLPGLLLAAWVRTLREPVRGQADGIPSPPEPHPFREFFLELRAVLPGLSLLHLSLAGGGRAAIVLNLTAALAIALAAFGLIAITGDAAQWIALGIGLYSAVSWIQGLGLRDRPTAALVFETPSLRYVGLGMAFLAFTGYGVGFWTAPFFVRIHGADLMEVGFVLGGTAALGGWLGVTLGGVMADARRRSSINGRIHIALLGAILPIPIGVWLLQTESLTLAYVLNFPLSILTSMWISIGAATVQDLVLPRMRASASAFYILVITFVGLALGPYLIGQVSDVLGNLRTAMTFAFCSNGLAVLFLVAAMRHLGRDEGSVLERARAAGEPGL